MTAFSHALLRTLLLLAITTASVAAPPPLPALDIAIEDTSVSGISSGGFMAAQVQVAHASIIRGAGIVAGSDPDRELAETELKLRAMLGSLGVAGEAR